MRRLELPGLLRTKIEQTFDRRLGARISGSPLVFDSLNERGFSALELVVVLALTGILATTGVLGLLNFQQAFERDATLKRVEYQIRRAKAEALSLGNRVTVVTEDSGATLALGRDSFPYDPDGDADEVINRSELPRGSDVILMQPIIFDSRGLLITPAGALTSSTAVVRRDGATYCSVNISSSGVLDFVC